MAEAAAEDRWNHTSSILAMIANASRDAKKKPTPFKPADFNPLAKARRRQGIRITADNVGLLKRLVRSKES